VKYTYMNSNTTVVTGQWPRDTGVENANSKFTFPVDNFLRVFGCG